MRSRSRAERPRAIFLARAAALLALCLSRAPAWAAPAAGPAPEPMMSLDLDVTAPAPDLAPSQVSPSLGASEYKFRRQGIEAAPQGDNAPLNQVLLQAPGVAQDSFGQLHVRGDHANMQFRLNGIELPEGIDVFGQALETRLANSVSLITGALPARYGFRTAGVVDIETKSGGIEPGGSVSMYGGTRSWLQPSFENGGTAGGVDYFVTGEYLRNAIGIENPTASYAAIHDRTDQQRGFAYLSGALDPATRLTAIAGISRSQYQIPNNPAQAPGLGLVVNGVSDFDSSQLNENQREITQYGVVTLQRKGDEGNLQIAAFSRYSSVYFTPDPLGDLLFNGIAQTAYRRSVATGSQGDARYVLSPDHTLRAGYLIQGERSTAATQSQVIPLAPDDTQASTTSVSIFDGSGKTGQLYGLYLEDEWKVTNAVTIDFGARFDRVEEYARGQQLSPRINIVWQPDGDTTLHAGYARYFTPPPFELVAPTDIALFANTSAAPAVTADDAPKPERDHYFDAGLSRIVLPGLKIALDGYYKIASDLLDEGQFGAPILLTPFNYAKGVVKGAELSASYDIGAWRFYGNFAASKAMGKDIVSGQFNFSPADLAYIADHYIHLDHDQTYTASGGVAYALASNTRVSASLIYGSGLRATNGEVPNGSTLPSYAQVNLGLVQKFDTGLWRGIELRLDVINLFDTKYEIRNGTGVGVGAPQFGPRRTVLAGLTQKF